MIKTLKLLLREGRRETLRKFLLFLASIFAIGVLVGCSGGTKKVEVVTDFTQPIIDGQDVRGYGAAAFRAEDGKLRDAFNAELAKLKDSGELLTLLEENGFSQLELPGDATMLELCGDQAIASTTDGDTLEKAVAAGKITVGFADEKPYAYRDANGELRGEAISIATAVFNRLGIAEVEGELVEFGQLIPGLQAGRFDVVTAGMYITPERCEQVIFAEPEYSIGEGLAVVEGNPLDLHSYEDIAENPEATIAVMKGGIEIKYMEAVGVKKDQILQYPDQAAVINAVQSGRADAATMTSMSMKEILASLDN